MPATSTSWRRSGEWARANCRRDIARPASEPTHSLNEAEEKTVRHVLALHKGNITRAAGALGIGRNTLYAEIRRYGIFLR